MVILDIFHILVLGKEGCRLVGGCPRRRWRGDTHHWEEPSMDQYQSRGKTFGELPGPLVHKSLLENKGGGAIGPYEFPLKFICTNGSQTSLKSSGLHWHRSIEWERVCREGGWGTENILFWG